MTVLYAQQQVGVADGTTIPVTKADGREVNAKKRVILASKVTGTNWTTSDSVYLGKKRAGEKITAIRCTTDTSFGTSTLTIGTLATPAKYVNAATLTAVNVPTALGPLASTLDDAPGAEEDLYLTIGVGTIVSATVATFEIEVCG